MSRTTKPARANANPPLSSSPYPAAPPSAQPAQPGALSYARSEAFPSSSVPMDYSPAAAVLLRGLAAPHPSCPREVGDAPLGSEGAASVQPLQWGSGGGRGRARNPAVPAPLRSCS